MILIELADPKEYTHICLCAVAIRRYQGRVMVRIELGALDEEGEFVPTRNQVLMAKDKAFEPLFTAMKKDRLNAVVEWLGTQGFEGTVV